MNDLEELPGNAVTALTIPLTTEVFGELRIPKSIVVTEELEVIAQRAAELARRSKAENTLRAYRSAWKQYSVWCARFGFEPVGADPQVVALHIADIADRLAPSTIRLRLSAIVAAHRLLGLQLDPKHNAIAAVLGGAMRPTDPHRKRLAKPLQSTTLRKIAEACPADAVGVRDRAMLLLGFGAACRRSELAALAIADVVLDERGVVVAITRSKTDQEGEGEVVAIHGSEDPILDVRAALAAWLAIRYRRRAKDQGKPLPDDLETGRAPLFCQLAKNGQPIGRRLSDYAVVRMIKSAAIRAGLDPTGYSGHSLRSGLATTAAANGATLAEIMDQGRWKSVEMAKHYVRDAEIWRNAASKAMAMTESGK
jgi:integrase